MTGSDSEVEQTRIEVCPAAELPPGSRTIVDVDGREIGVFNVDGELFAIDNVCPHQLAPLCEGTLTGKVTAPAVREYELTRQGKVVRCPWHGWKFDLETGESVFNPHLRTGTYDATVESVGDESAAEPADGAAADACGDDGGTCEYGTELAGDEPPVDTYDVEREREIVVLYV